MRTQQPPCTRACRCVHVRACTCTHVCIRVCTPARTCAYSSSQLHHHQQQQQQPHHHITFTFTFTLYLSSSAPFWSVSKSRPAREGDQSQEFYSHMYIITQGHSEQWNSWDMAVRKKVGNIFDAYTVYMHWKYTYIHMKNIHNLDNTIYIIKIKNKKCNVM